MAFRSEHQEWLDELSGKSRTHLSGHLLAILIGAALAALAVTIERLVL